MSWASLVDITAVYVPTPPCTEQMKALVDWAQLRVAGDYHHVGSVANGSAVALPGTVTGVTALASDAESLDNVPFFSEVGYQHTTETYMQLLGSRISPTLVAKFRAALERLRASSVAAASSPVRKRAPRIPHRKLSPDGH
jgi:hypothetical protein